MVAESVQGSYEKEVVVNALLEDGKGSEAVSILQSLIALNLSNKDWHYYQLGKAYSLDKKWAKAAESFMQALKLNPQLAIAAVGFGDVSVAMRAYEEAEKAYLHALKYKSVYPELAQSYLHLGKMLVNEQQYEFALHAYKNALDLDQDLSLELIDIYKTLHETLVQQNNTDLTQKITARITMIEEEVAAEKASSEINESEVLLLQLHQVQEELETYFIQNQELELKLQNTEAKLQNANTKLQDTEAKLQKIENKSREELQQLKQENMEYIQRQQLFEGEFIKAEAQIELIKDILVKESFL